MLVAKGLASQEELSLLLVVGRKDTGGLEAQIRGSRYAWDMRIISVDALLRLMELKETLEDPTTVQRISSILVPQEFTKLDAVIGLVFATAEEVASPDATALDDFPEEECKSKKRKPKFTPVSFHEACAERIENVLGVSLIKQFRSMYRTPDERIRVWVTVSKQHGTRGAENYWFAFHPHQRETLNQTESAYCALGCGSADNLFLIPFSEIESILNITWTTQRDDRMYWHIRVESRKGVHRIALRKGNENVAIDKYRE